MSSVRASLAYSIASANIVAVLQFGSTMALSRLLTPAEIGVYSVAAVLIGIAAIFREFGIGNYLIQADVLTRESLRAAFAMMLATAIIIGVSLLTAAPAFASFYREPQLVAIVQLLAVNFFLTPFGFITLAVARREMRFKALTIVRLFSTITAISTSISLAFLDFGAMSLAWGGVSGTAASVFGATFLRTKEIPALPSFKGSRKILSFSISSVGASFFSYVNTNASDIVIGRMLNMEAVGLFNRATSLAQFIIATFNRAINPIMLPWLSQLKRNKEPAVRAFSKITELVTGITWPLFAMIAILSEPLIEFLFGDQWGASSALVPYICFTVALSSTFQAAAPTYISRGMPQIELAVQAINLPVKIMTIILAAPYGLSMVAMVWPVSATVGAITHLVFLKKFVGIPMSSAFISTKKSAIVTLVVLVATGLADRLLTEIESPIFAHLVAAGSVAAMCYGLSTWAVSHPLFQELSAILRSIKQRRAK